MAHHLLILRFGAMLLCTLLCCFHAFAQTRLQIPLFSPLKRLALVLMLICGVYPSVYAQNSGGIKSTKAKKQKTDTAPIQQKVLIFTKESCLRCRDFKAFALANDVVFEERDLANESNNSQMWSYLRSAGYEGMAFTPVLVIGSEVISCKSNDEFPTILKRIFTGEKKVVITEQVQQKAEQTKTSAPKQVKKKSKEILTKESAITYKETNIDDVRYKLPKRALDKFMVALRANNGKYVSFGTGLLKSDISANASIITEKEILTCVKLSNDSVAFITHTGGYWGIQTTLFGNIFSITEQEIQRQSQFKLFIQNGNICGIKSGTGKFITCIDGSVGFECEEMCTSATFEIIGVGCQLEFKKPHSIQAWYSYDKPRDIEQDTWAVLLANRYENEKKPQIVLISQSNSSSARTLGKLLSQDLVIHEYFANTSQYIAKYAQRKTKASEPTYPILISNVNIFDGSKLGFKKDGSVDKIRLSNVLSELVTYSQRYTKTTSLLFQQEDFLTPLEQQVLDEVNFARTRPKEYAQKLEKRRFYRYTEGVSVLDEAIRDMRAYKSREPLIASLGLTRAAIDHAQDTGPKGIVGHDGSDGSKPSTRSQRYGQVSYLGENISYGATTAEDIVADLIIDDGVPSRGHRKNIMNEKYNVIGLSEGNHSTYRVMFVMDFASVYEELGIKPLRMW